MAKKYQSVRGMNDILPTESTQWQELEKTVINWTHAYGYNEIRTPILEPTSLFVRSIGQVTDIVEKEMYTFIDSLNGESLTLRPEGTASCLRAALQHNLLYNQTQRLWYKGAMFRHERPQKGRYRQFHQIGVEALGFQGPDIDAEIIAMSSDLWQRLGVTQARLELNSLGDKQERLHYIGKLVEYLKQYEQDFDDETIYRLYNNPLRILDSKDSTLQSIVEQAPCLLDCLGAASRTHFDYLCVLLERLNIPFTINHRLVRGLDYYNMTVFEWKTDVLGAQSTICAGGRYDGLIEALGGESMAAVGFALGIERLLLLIQHQQLSLPTAVPDIYIVRQSEQMIPIAIELAQLLRQHNKKVILHCGSGTIKSQMKKADTSGAIHALIVKENEVTLKALRTQSDPITMPIAEILNFI